MLYFLLTFRFGGSPQFDILWEDLTCEETLLFYSRLKGVPPKEEQEHVKQALYDIGLDQYSKRMAKQLSGGMKRRLSMGVALVGDPKVCITHGLVLGLCVCMYVCTYFVFLGCGRECSHCGRRTDPSVCAARVCFVHSLCCCFSPFNLR